MPAGDRRGAALLREPAQGAPLQRRRADRRPRLRGLFQLPHPGLPGRHRAGLRHRGFGPDPAPAPAAGLRRDPAEPHPAPLLPRRSRLPRRHQHPAAGQEPPRAGDPGAAAEEAGQRHLPRRRRPPGAPGDPHRRRLRRAARRRRAAGAAAPAGGGPARPGGDRRSLRHSADPRVRPGDRVPEPGPGGRPIPSSVPACSRATAPASRRSTTAPTSRST